jgi:uroporphyrinogen-III synthase
MSRPVLVTRAQPGAAGTLARLKAEGYAAIAAPTARIQARPVDPPADAAALAVTSRHGALRAAALCSDRTLPVFAVGEASAAAAREKGFTDVRSAAGDGPALAELIACARPAGLVVHVRGRDQAFDLVADLTARGLNAQGLIAYAAEPVLRLPLAAEAAVRAGATVLVHSAKGAERFLALVEAAGLSSHLAAQRVVAISCQAAAPVLDAGAGRIDIAAKPTEDAMFQALAAARD